MIIVWIWLVGFVVAWGYEREANLFTPSLVDSYVRAILWPVRLGIVVWDEVVYKLKDWKRK